MKINDLMLFTLILLATTFGCKPKPEHLTGIVIDSLHLKEVVLGIPIKDWMSGQTLNLDSIDFSDTILPVRLIGTVVYIDLVAHNASLILTNAINDTLVTDPVFADIKIRKAKFRLNVNGQPRVLTLSNIIVKNWQVQSVRLSQFHDADPNTSRLKELSAQNEAAKKEFENLHALHEQIKADDPLHAALLLDDELAALERRIGEIDEYLKNHKPYSGIDPKTIEFKILEVIDTRSNINSMQDRLIDDRNSPRALVVYFEPGKFDIESIKDKTALANYLNEIESEMKLNSDADTFNLFLTVTAFADSVPVGIKKGLRQKLMNLYNDTCITAIDNSSCWNYLLSKARSEAVLYYLEASIENTTNILGIKMNIKSSFFGKGLEKPDIFIGDCLSLECAQRRIALVSRIVEPVLTKPF